MFLSTFINVTEETLANGVHKALFNVSTNVKNIFNNATLQKTNVRSQFVLIIKCENTFKKFIKKQRM